jgi:hypothetical protein
MLIARNYHISYLSRLIMIMGARKKLKNSLRINQINNQLYLENRRIITLKHHLSTDMKMVLRLTQKICPIKK